MRIETDLGDAIRRKLQSRSLDHEIARIAGDQHGVVALRQLVSRGACRRAVARRVERHQLRVVHRGVYAAQPGLLSEKGRIMAAVLAGGDGAAASHLAAARLHELGVPASAVVDITAPCGLRRRPGITFHHSIVPADELTGINGIPVTTTARTLLDLAALLPPHRLESAIDEAEYRRLTDVVPLRALLDRYPGRRGVSALRAILDSLTLGDDRTESDLEDLFPVFLDERRLPRPRANVTMTVGGLRIRPDCVWFDERVIVELDGRAAHRRRRSFESDRARDRKLQVAGWRVVRVTWAQLHTERDALERDLRALLGV